MPVRDAPAIDARTTCQGGDADVGSSFRIGAKGPAIASSRAAARWLAGDIGEELAGFAGRPARVRAEPEFNAIGQWRADLNAPTNAVRRHRILKRHAVRCGASRRDARKAAHQVAPLPVSKRAPLPFALADKPD